MNDVDRLKALLSVVFEELDEGDGNAPGCGHENPGIWDADNMPQIAGKSCRWCAIWAQVREIAS